MAKIVIPAKVFLPEDGADDSHPILVVEEQASELGNLIADHGIQVAEAGSEPESTPHSHGGELESDDSADAEEEVKPANGFRTCMSELLSRPEGAERLSQLEARLRFKESARACSARRAEEALENN